MRFLEKDWSDLRGSKIHIAVPAPCDLLRGHVVTLDDVVGSIDEVSPRWQLDAILALDDYLDD
jgi:hypothetical protein